MAIAHNADSNANSGTGTVGSLTWAHTCTGSNLVLVVGLLYTGTTTTLDNVGVQYAGVSATGQTNVVDCNGVNTSHTRLFWWINPATGTNNIVATPSLACSMFGGGSSFTGVDQTNPVLSLTAVPSNYATSFGSSFGTISQSFHTSTDGELLFSLLGMANATSTLAAVSPAIEAYNQGDTTAARRAEGEYLLTTRKTKYTTSQTISGSTARAWAQQLIGLRPIDAPLVNPTVFNNYTFGTADSGMSTSEKIR